MKRLDAPLLVGEINVVGKSAGGGEMTRRYYDYFAREGWAATLWTWKELRPEGGLHANMWMLVTNRDPLPRLDFQTSSKQEIEAVFRSLSTMPMAVDEDLRHWLTTDQQPAPLPTTFPTAVPTTQAGPATAPTTRP